MPVEASRSTTARSRYTDVFREKTLRFQLFVAQCFLGKLCRLNATYPPNRTLDDVIFVFQPGKEAGHDSSDVVDGDLGCAAHGLVVVKILAQIIADNRTDRLVDRC